MRIESSRDRRKRKRLEALNQTLAKIEQELTILQQFRRTPHIERLERQLHGERSYVRQQIRKLEGTEGKERRGESRQRVANKQRSSKMKRTW